MKACPKDPSKNTLLMKTLHPPQRMTSLTPSYPHPLSLIHRKLKAKQQLPQKRRNLTQSSCANLCGLVRCAVCRLAIVLILLGAQTQHVDHDVAQTVSFGIQSERERNLSNKVRYTGRTETSSTRETTRRGLAPPLQPSGWPQQIFD